MSKRIKDKKLTKEEFLELELLHAKSDIMNREKVILELRKELIDMKKSLLVYANKEMEVNLVDLDKTLSALNKKAEDGKKERESSIGKVKKRLKIKGRFGYDPDTLAVLEE